MSFSDGAPWWPLVPAALLGYLCADVLSGAAHWFCDTFFDEETPIIGEVLIRPFRDHHIHPQRITQYRFIEQDTTNFFIMIPLLATAPGHDLSHRGLAGVGLDAHGLRARRLGAGHLRAPRRRADRPRASQRSRHAVSFDAVGSSRGRRHCAIGREPRVGWRLAPMETTHCSHSRGRSSWVGWRLAPMAPTCSTSGLTLVPSPAAPIDSGTRPTPNPPCRSLKRILCHFGLDEFTPRCDRLLSSPRGRSAPPR